LSVEGSRWAFQLILNRNLGQAFDTKGKVSPLAGKAAQIKPRAAEFYDQNFCDSIKTKTTKDQGI
jgi:hypothetical protein